MSDGPKICGGCNQNIPSRWVTGLNKFWHHDCFRCTSCNRVVAPTESFYDNGGKPECFNCKGAPQVHTCGICNGTISGQRLIYLANTYHYGCKRCTKCNQAFTADQHANIKILANGDFVHTNC
ncbi:four and a half LIM domains protein 1-like isoform X2 [Bolinopsis microptera]|uniref:four and a half LIM domains protein 1-like isoform X1 n=1 Tax=Bolinopsis microptera TaxID=2820187 RepID=UPI003078C936